MPAKSKAASKKSSSDHNVSDKKSSINYSKVHKLMVFTKPKHREKFLKWLASHESKKEFDFEQLYFQWPSSATVVYPAIPIKDVYRENNIILLPYLACMGDKTHLNFLSKILEQSQKARDYQYPFHGDPKRSIKGFSVFHLLISNKTIQTDIDFARDYLNKNIKHFKINDQHNYTGFSPLHHVLNLNSVPLALAELLLEYKPDLTLRTLSGNISLVDVAYWRARSLLPHFTKQGLFPNYSVLFNLMASSGLTEDIAQMDADPSMEESRKLFNVDHQGNSQSDTPLMSAVRENNIDMIAILLRKGADPSLRLADKKTSALKIAVQKGNCEVVKLLLGSPRGVDAITGMNDDNLLIDAILFLKENVFAQINILKQLLDSLKTKANTKMMKYIKECYYEDGSSFLQMLVKLKKNTLLELSLRYPTLIDVEVRTKDDLNLLELAAKENSLDCMRSLLKHEECKVIEKNPDNLLCLTIDNRSYQCLWVLVEQKIIRPIAAFRSLSLIKKNYDKILMKEMGDDNIFDNTFDNILALVPKDQVAGIFYNSLITQMTMNLDSTMAINLYKKYKKQEAYNDVANDNNHKDVMEAARVNKVFFIYNDLQKRYRPRSPSFASGPLGDCDSATEVPIHPPLPPQKGMTGPAYLASIFQLGAQEVQELRQQVRDKKYAGKMPPAEKFSMISEEKKLVPLKPFFNGLEFSELPPGRLLSVKSKNNVRTFLVLPDESWCSKFLDIEGINLLKRHFKEGEQINYESKGVNQGLKKLERAKLADSSITLNGVKRDLIQGKRELWEFVTQDAHNGDDRPMFIMVQSDPDPDNQKNDLLFVFVGILNKGAHNHQAISMSKVDLVITSNPTLQFVPSGVDEEEDQPNPFRVMFGYS